MERYKKEQSKPERKIMTGKETTFLCILLVLALGFLVARPLLTPSTEGNVAVVSVDGKEVTRYVLSDYMQAEPKEYYFLEQYHIPVSVILQKGTIRFSQVDCPDQICVNTGAIREDTEIAVCMPNKTSISVYTAQQAEKLNK